MILVVLKKLFIVKCVCNVRINFNAFFSFIEVGCNSKPNFGFPFFFFVIGMEHAIAISNVRSVLKMAFRLLKW